MIKNIISTVIFIFFVQLNSDAFLMAQEEVAANREKLTIWVRAFGVEAKKEIIPYLQYITDELSPNFNLNILIATNLNDPVADVLENETSLSSVKLIYANMNSNHQGLNALASATKINSFVLSISLGVKIKNSHLIEAFKWIKEGAWVFGWKISNMNNDGSQPGLGWYNTAALYSPICLNWLKDNPFPYWIDNGVEGYLDIDNEKIMIGNNEEVVLMATVLQQGIHSAYYVLNVCDTLDLPFQTGNGISFESKLKRKIHASKYYLENKFNVSASNVWDRLRIISEVKTKDAIPLADRLRIHMLRFPSYKERLT